MKGRNLMPIRLIGGFLIGLMLTACGTDETTSSGTSSTTTTEAAVRPIVQEMDATIDLEAGGEVSHLEGFCNSGPTSLVVGVFEDEPGVTDTSIVLSFSGPDDPTPDNVVDWVVTRNDGRFAYVNGTISTELAEDGVSGSLTGSELLYEDSTTAKMPLSLRWSCTEH